MNPIEADAARALAHNAHAFAGWFEDHLRRNGHQVNPSDSSQPKEQAMTTPQQPQQPQTVVESLHALTGEIAANKLVSRLVQYGIGKRLTDQQADHLVTVIADMEQPPPQPQFTPHDDQAQFPADGQHQQ